MTNEELDSYVKALDAAVAEQQSIREQIAVLEKRDARLEETIATLVRLINDADGDFTSGDPSSEVGLTDTVRRVLKGADGPLTPVQVRDGVIKMGKSESNYTNLLASVHNILKRLVLSNEAKRIESDEGTVYSWVKPTPRWFSTLVEAGLFDPVTKIRRDVEEMKEFISGVNEVTGIMPREEKPSGVKLQPSEQKKRDIRPGQQRAVDESLARTYREKVDEEMKKKEGK